ncbi:hypothetical protein KSF78_0008423 [Schistosoma japonicum]|nr:hypothetical protein KSF78_0008423 [Schistosoma japonicum]
MSSSSSSSLLYINVLLLVLIRSSIQIGILSDAISNATRRLLESQGLKNKYLGFIVTTGNYIDRQRAKMLKANPEEQENFDNYMSCISSREAKDYQRRLAKDIGYLEKEFTKDYPGHSEKLLENLKLCRVILEQHFNELVDLQRSYQGQVSNYKYMNQFKCKIDGTLYHNR